MSIEIFVVLPNSTLTSPCFSLIDFMLSLPQIIRISARASKLETSSGIGPNLSLSSVITDSNYSNTAYDGFFKSRRSKGVCTLPTLDI